MRRTASTHTTDLFFGDPSLLPFFLRFLLEACPVDAIGRLGAANRLCRATTKEAARLAVLQTLEVQEWCWSKTWTAYWILLAAVAADSSACLALKGALSSRTAMLDRSSAQAALMLLASDGGGLRGITKRVLGAAGPRGMLVPQRRLLHALCFHAGALSGANAPNLASLNVFKAKGTHLEIPTLLDLAELFNLRVYMRTYVKSSQRFSEELCYALTASATAWERAQTPCLRARWMLGRTLASAAHALALTAVVGVPRIQMLRRWKGVDEMFARALSEHRVAVQLNGLPKSSFFRFSGVDTSDMPLDNGIMLERGLLLASLGECWYCAASAAGYRGAVMGRNEEELAANSLEAFEQALQIFRSARLERTVEYADALKDYGKVQLNYARLGTGPESLLASCDLHLTLFGRDHPRTRNALRLLPPSSVPRRLHA